MTTRQWASQGRSPDSRPELAFGIGQVAGADAAEGHLIGHGLIREAQVYVWPAPRKAPVSTDVSTMCQIRRELTQRQHFNPIKTPLLPSDYTARSHDASVWLFDLDFVPYFLHLDTGAKKDM